MCWPVTLRWAGTVPALTLQAQKWARTPIIGKDWWAGWWAQGLHYTILFCVFNVHNKESKANKKLEICILLLATAPNLLYCHWGRTLVTIHWACSTLFLSSIKRQLNCSSYLTCLPHLPHLCKTSAVMWVQSPKEALSRGHSLAANGQIGPQMRFCLAQRMFSLIRVQCHRWAWLSNSPQSSPPITLLLSGPINLYVPYLAPVGICVSESKTGGTVVVFSIYAGM